MGAASILFLGLTALSAGSKFSAARDQAKEVVRQSEVAGKERAKSTRLKAARQTVSFLNSGITLEGTSGDIVSETFDTGIADIKQISRNANVKSRNIVSSARTDAISSIVSSAAGAGFGTSAGSMFSGAQFGAQTGGQAFGSGGFGNVIGGATGKFGPGF